MRGGTAVGRRRRLLSEEAPGIATVPMNKVAMNGHQHHHLNLHGNGQTILPSWVKKAEIISHLCFFSFWYTPPPS